MLQNNICSYEVSIWTLQDEFITVLKPSNLDYRGQLEEPKLVIDVDGTENFSFSIPMYIYQTIEEDYIKVENPIWFNTRNQNLIAGMKKIKVILNKNTINEAVYEFLITKVTERHENDELYCDVECEGLAFHELGKLGYKISLSSEMYEEEYNESIEAGQEPKLNNIQYWNDKIFIGNTSWTYEVQMDWSAYQDGVLRRSDKIYENEYVTSWKLQDDKMMPREVASYREKARAVDLEESNIYNLTQDIAKIFGVFCRYEYGHDDNYHITSKKVIYYNNFLEEQQGAIDLTYPYSSISITREMDSSNIVSKLFVRPVDYEEVASGLITILDTEANKSREDYLLNFDYLYNIGAINEDQYAAISEYEKEMYKLNSEIIPLSQMLMEWRNQLPEISAKRKMAENSLPLDDEQINQATALLDALTDGTGYIIVNESRPSVVAAMPDSSSPGTYYIRITELGILPETLHIYKTYSAGQTDNPLTNEITGIFQYDEYNNLTSVTGLKLNQGDSSVLYLIYTYSPKLYYEQVEASWRRKKAKDQTDKENYMLQENELSEKIEIKQQEYEEKLEEKRNKIIDFERLMGPALREGYWQPEDYKDDGDKYLSTLNFLNTTNDAHANVIWDEELFNDEQKNYYEIGINQDIEYYPCIDLSDYWDYIKEHLDNLSFIYYDTEAIARTNLAKYRTYSVGSQSMFRFLKNSDTNEIIPVLMLIGAESLYFNHEQFTNSTDYLNRSILQPRLGNVKAVVESNGVTLTIENEQSVLDKFISYENLQKYKFVYPRIEINSTSLKNNSTDLFLLYDNNALTNFEDYYVLMRDEAYYITIKPEIFFSYGGIDKDLILKYTLSNADTSIYLDALKVLKENAFPKVSYTIDPSVINKNLLNILYKLLSHIVHINDYELKFENVQGYVSHLELILDRIQESTIEIKNYKTKFEDLFTNIVVQTEQMRKDTSIIDAAAIALNSDGTLKQETITNAFNNNSQTLDSYLNSYFDNSLLVQEKLGSLFNEAGELLHEANKGLVNAQSLTKSNATILSGFLTNVKEGFENGIDYSEEVLLQSGDQKRISAVRINKDEGIFIGSNKKITLSTINAIQDNQGRYITDPDKATGANIEITPARIFLGVSKINNEASGIIDITSDQIIIANGTASNTLETNPVDEITNNAALSGIQIKKDYIGLALTKNNKRSIISIKPTDITFGNATLNQTGSYVKISEEKIEMGSNSDLYLNTNNMKLQSDATGTGLGETLFAIGTNLNNITSDTTATAAVAAINNNTLSLLLNKSGLYIKGTIYATGGSFTGDVSANTFIATSTNGKLKASGNLLGIYDSSDNPVLTLSSAGLVAAEDFSITTGNTFSIESGGNITINSNNFILDSSKTGTNNILELKNSNNDKILTFSPTNGLQITGQVQATSFTINGHLLGIDDVNGLQSALDAAASSGDFSISGISSNYTWNGNTYTVALTSTDSLLIGANNTNGGGIIITKDANTAAVIIDKTGINFNVDANTFIHMSSTGVQVKGSKIQMSDPNGELKDIWSHDNIVVMNSNITDSSNSDYWRRSIDSIEQKMIDKHDWVLIRPYYDAQITYYQNNTIDTNVARSGFSVTLPSTDQQQFGDTSTQYTYKLKFNWRTESSTTYNAGQQAIITLTSTSGGSSRTVSWRENSLPKIPDVYNPEEIELSYSFGQGSSNNLCQGNTNITVQIDIVGMNDTITFSNIQLQCSCDATNSRVPCTVYYYP